MNKDIFNTIFTDILDNDIKSIYKIHLICKDWKKQILSLQNRDTIKHKLRIISKRMHPFSFQPNRRMCDAACHGYMDIVNLMIEKGADNWNIPMIAAAYSGHIDIVNLMIEKGANCWSGCISSAANGDHIDILRLIIEKATIQNINWNSVMWETTHRGRINIAKLMIENGVECQARYAEFAAKEGHIDLIKLMIEENWQANINWGVVLNIAEREGYTDIVELIQRSLHR